MGLLSHGQLCFGFNIDGYRDHDLVGKEVKGRVVVLTGSRFILFYRLSNLIPNHNNRLPLTLSEHL
jgi:hypothetical protein